MTDVIAGAEIQSSLLSQKWSQAGHRILYISLFGIHGTQACNTILDPSGVRIIRFEKSISGLKKIYLILRILRMYQPDVVYYRNHEGLFTFALLCKFLRLPFVYHVSSVNSQTPFSVPAARRRYLLPIKFVIVNSVQIVNFLGLYLADEVIVLNRHFMANLQRFWIRTHLCLDLLPESEAEQDPELLPSPYVLWVSNIKSIKEPESYIRLADEISADVRFVMIGAFQEERYRMIIREAMARNRRFIYVGPKSLKQTNYWLLNSLFLVHTCIPEGFPNNFLQAWYAEKPTVSLHYDPDNIATAHDIGYFSGSFEQFKKDVLSLIFDERKRIAMGGRAGKFARTNFGQDEIANSVLSVLRHACRSSSE